MMAAPPVTLADIGIARLSALCQAIGYGADQTRRALDVFGVLSGSWGSTPVNKGAKWSSDITDDHTPFEFSLAMDGAVPELRFLIEAQGERPSIASNWKAALELNDRLAADFGAHLERLRMVQDLFEPENERCRFALWHAVCLLPNGNIDFKVYLNPQARGRANARLLVQTAMERLGLGACRRFLPSTDRQGEVCYLSLDLSARPEARIKVYTAHYHATTARIEAGVASAQGYVPGKSTEFCRAMASGREPYSARPVLTCLSFVQGQDRPTTGTVHFPVRSYAPSDREVLNRVTSYIHAGAASTYRHVLESFTDRELEDGIGMQTYVSLRLERGKNRLTVYLAPEAYDVGQVAASQPAVSGILPRPGRARETFSFALAKNS